MARRPNSSPQTRLVIAVLADRPEAWRHGYDLSKETGVGPGTLYPLLIRLEEQGILLSRWEPSENPRRPARHVYRLTPKGMDMAREISEQPANGWALLAGEPA